MRFRRSAVLPLRLRLQALEAREVPADISAPAFLQIFEATHNTIEKRSPDIFAAGYGSIWAPPPGQADQGDLSVGYDPYDRFDLGSPANPTLYGTETRLKIAILQLNRSGILYTSDFILNHNGFSDRSTSGFVAAGGYPGVWIGPTTGNPIDGDFHAASATGDLNVRVAGLIDIDQSTNTQFVRNPVPGFANNIPAGTTPAFGRLANVPAEGNRRFYTDHALTPITVFDPSTGEMNIAIYPFNNADPTAGDPGAENAMGYLMRNAQWLVQTIGIDGFRLDAVKHVPIFALNYFDRAVYRSNPDYNLDGTQRGVFSFGENFDGNKPYLQGYIRKDINPNTPGVIGGNRDVLDFPLFFAMQNNLTGNGIQNDWNNIVNASQDSQDDGLANNGSQGVAFVSSHDSGPPTLSTVAYAYTLMRPGNAIVYFNAKEFGNGRSFPADGRGDAVGGFYGDAITKLVQIRNGYGRGNYQPRLLEKESLIYERENSALVVLSNRLDAGFDARTVQTGFPAGTALVELTGNAADPIVDPFGDFPDVLVVNANGTVNLRVPRNKAPGASGAQHNRGYFIYGPSAPIGAMTILGATSTIAADVPTANTNGTAQLTALPVITGNSFQVQFNTSAVTLAGNIRDADADGDNALIRIDDGVDINSSGKVDYRNPADVSYGFEEFTTVKMPGFGSATGNGSYLQTINTTGLAEGVHYLTVRAFRHRTSGTAIYKDFRQAFYVDRTAPVSAIDSFNPIVVGTNENRRAQVRSTDLTGNNVHVFLNLPASLSNAQVLSMVGGGSQANNIDRDLWTKDFNGLQNGNHVLTVVTFERDGTTNVQRFPNFAVTSIFGAGTGDLNFDGLFTSADVNLFSTILAGNNNQFNPAGDFNGDGLINNSDLLQYGAKLTSLNATAALTTFRTILGPSASYAINEGQNLTLAMNRPTGGAPTLTITWDLNNDGTFGDALGGPSSATWAQLVGLGVNVAGSYPVAVRTTDGTNTYTQTSLLSVFSAAPLGTLTNNGTAYPGSALATVSFINVSHPSPVVTAGGFNYSFDFNNDGIYEVVNSASPTVSVPTQYVVHPQVIVRGRVTTPANGFSFVTSTTIAVVVPPRVLGVVVNDGSAQRSRVTSLTVNFDAAVVLPSPPTLAFALTGPGSTTIALTANVVSPTQVVLTFGGAGTTGGSLDDGAYSLALDAALITGAGGALDGDANGTPGGAYSFNVVRKFGDADGDGDVDISDFVAFRLVFGTANAAVFDADGDGDADIADFVAFRLRFGT